MMDYEVQRCTRRCLTTQRELGEGETFYSALVPEGSQVVRRDFCADAWHGPPEGAIGWWKSQVPVAEHKRAVLAPNDVLYGYFQELLEQPGQADVAYVLALLLVRRRVLKIEEHIEPTAEETLVLFCPRDEATYRVAAVMPSEERVTEIENQLGQLLFAHSN